MTASQLDGRFILFKANELLNMDYVKFHVAHYFQQIVKMTGCVRVTRSHGLAASPTLDVSC